MKPGRMLAYACAVVLLAVVACWHVQRVGVSSRTPAPRASSSRAPAPQVHLVRDTAELYSLWKTQGYRGRILVHLGRHFHFVPVELNVGRGALPPDVQDDDKTLAYYESRLDFRNALWIAMAANFFREIYYVLPPDIYREKVAQVKGAGDIPVQGGDGIRLVTLGLNRSISDRLPVVSEPVVLNVDASYLQSSDARTVVGQLRQKGLLPETISFCLSTGSPDVTDHERNQLRRLADEFAAGRSIP